MASFVREPAKGPRELFVKGMLGIVPVDRCAVSTSSIFRDQDLLAST
jgi:hypothetical protein